MDLLTRLATLGYSFCDVLFATSGSKFFSFREDPFSEGETKSVLELLPLNEYQLRNISSSSDLLNNKSLFGGQL